MNVAKRLGFAAAMVTLFTLGAAADNDGATIQRFPLDDTFDYPCLGEPVHVTGVIRVAIHNVESANGGIHAQLLINVEQVAAVGLTTGTAYRYRVSFMDVLNADSDFAQLTATAASRTVLESLDGGPALVMQAFVKFVRDAAGNVVISIDSSGDSCTP